MDNKERNISRAEVIKALAHPSRLAMIYRLEKGEACVCELQKIVEADMSTVSKHLSLMKKAGLVDDRKEGLWVYYRLRVPCVIRFLDCIDTVVENGSNINNQYSTRNNQCQSNEVEVK
ncbi:winged helix-turn-helix transcriptional regulator [bacterium]|nr:winged helix-turn-helix transcriptional regulator [bacterium]